jgi:hypothetical protein
LIGGFDNDCAFIANDVKADSIGFQADGVGCLLSVIAGSKLR